MLAALAGALVLQACSGSQTQPSPPPVPDAPKITCPAPISLPSPLASPISVVYGQATFINGAPPVTLACTPASGSIFPVGQTTVTCTATDQQQRNDSCTFSVTVTTPPKVSATSYLAFGDSMTAGEVVSEGSSLFRTLRVDAEKSYPADLQRDLVGRYTTQAQSIVVENQGLSGEPAVTGVSRLQGLLARGSYQVLTLMDGANDIGDRDSVTAQQALTAIRSMVQMAKGKGMHVLLATLPPQNSTACCPQRGLGASLVPSFNDGLRGIADSEHVSLVDVYQAFNGDNTTLIDVDGLHPTPAGYQVIADTFFSSIKAGLEQPATSSSVHPFRIMPSLVPPRRR